MTLDEFLVALEKTPRDWKLLERGQLRRYADNRPQCPLTAVVGESVWQLGSAAERLGLTECALEIADSADNQRHHFTPALRAKLLKACGLT